MAPFELLGHVFLDHVHRHVAGAFVHDLHPAIPGARGQFALHFKFPELRFVIGIGDGTGAQTVADGKAHVIGGHDLADLIPVSVEKILLVMREAPFGHDGPTATDDAGHAFGGEGNEAEEHAGMDGEVVDALFGLLDEGVAEDIPGEVLGLAACFFEGLIDGDRADGHRRVAQDPFARGVDVFSGGEVHHGVGAPFGRPAHFFDFFPDGRGHRTVADVGVDLHEEVAPDDHRFVFRMVDVGRDDGTAGGDFVAHEFRRDFAGDSLRETAEDGGREFTVRTLAAAGMLLAQALAVDVFRHVREVGATHVFPDGNVFHFGSDDALAGIPELGHGMAGRGTKGFPAESGELLERGLGLALGRVVGMGGGEIAVVARLGVASVVFGDITPGHNPLATQAGQAVLHVAAEFLVTPRAACVINPHRVVGLKLAVEIFGRRKTDLAEGHADVGVLAPGDVDPRAVGEGRSRSGTGGCGL